MKYNVKVTACAKASVNQTFTVEADSLEDAHQEAIEAAQSAPYGWNLDDMETDDDSIEVVETEPLDTE